MDCHLSHVSNVVARVVLHNMCKMFGDHCDVEWIHHEGPSGMQALTTGATTPVLVQMLFMYNGYRDVVGGLSLSSSPGACGLNGGVIGHIDG